MRQLLDTIINDEHLHAKWLNTLSYLENSGARKLAACEHSTLVKEEMLKHAADEFRHAHYLKKQIRKVSPIDLPDYSLLLGGYHTRHYLHKLDLYASRHIQDQPTYPFVTYAIELRAQMLYPLYEEALRKAGSNIFVKSIILEEEEHLNEMKQALTRHQKQAQAICAYEETLYSNWINAIEQELNLELLPSIL